MNCRNLLDYLICTDYAYNHTENLSLCYSFNNNQFNSVMQCAENRYSKNIKFHIIFSLICCQLVGLLRNFVPVQQSYGIKLGGHILFFDCVLRKNVVRNNLKYNCIGNDVRMSATSKVIGNDKLI